MLGSESRLDLRVIYRVCSVPPAGDSATIKVFIRAIYVGYFACQLAHRTIQMKSNSFPRRWSAVEYYVVSTSTVPELNSMYQSVRYNSSLYKQIQKFFISCLRLKMIRNFSLRYDNKFLTLLMVSQLKLMETQLKLIRSFYIIIPHIATTKILSINEAFMILQNV